MGDPLYCRRPRGSHRNRPSAGSHPAPPRPGPRPAAAPSTGSGPPDGRSGGGRGHLRRYAPSGRGPRGRRCGGGAGTGRRCGPWSVRSGAPASRRRGRRRSSGAWPAARARRVCPWPDITTSQHSRSEILGLCSSEKWTSARSRAGQCSPMWRTFSSVRARTSSDTIFLPCVMTTSTASPPRLRRSTATALGGRSSWSVDEGMGWDGMDRERRAADLVFDPTLACRGTHGRAPAAPTVSGPHPAVPLDGTRHPLSARPRQPGTPRAGLTPKPHHAQQPRVALRGSFRLRLASTCNHRPARRSPDEPTPAGRESEPWPAVFTEPSSNRHTVADGVQRSRRGLPVAGSPVRRRPRPAGA